MGAYVYLDAVKVKIQRQFLLRILLIFPCLPFFTHPHSPQIFYHLLRINPIMRFPHIQH